LVCFSYFDLIDKHGALKPLTNIRLKTSSMIRVRLIHQDIIHDKDIDVRQTVEQFKKYICQLFHLSSSRLRVFHVDDLAVTMGHGGPEELKYPQRLLHT
jgi:hypothetical protein